jgi:hypothetical protein
METINTILFSLKTLLIISSSTIKWIISCLITDNDDNDKINYNNIKSKNLVINNHKNDKKGPKVIE